MRVLDAKLKAHFEGDVTTLCNAWRVTRTDHVVLGFTDHDRAFDFDGTKFSPETGFLPGLAKSELGLNVDDGEVAGAFSSIAITEKDLADGRYDGAKVEIFLVNWQEPNSFLKLRTQEIGEVSYSDHMFQAELRSIAHRLDQPGGRTFSRRCSANLGDKACKVNLDNMAYKATGTVLSASDDRKATVSGLASFEAGWFRYGLITWLSGDNQGLSVEVHDHLVQDNDVSLAFFAPLINLPQAGDQFVITSGCEKDAATCRDKFANILNFQGFPHMPGSDFAYGYADSTTVHDGRPIVT